MKELDDGLWPVQTQNIITHDNISEAGHLIEENSQVAVNGLTVVLKMSVSSVLIVINKKIRLNRACVCCWVLHQLPLRQSRCILQGPAGLI
jgi:hypothetical protein